MQGRWRSRIAADGEAVIRIDDRRLGLSSHDTAAEIPWGDLGVDLALACTGKFLTPETLHGHPDLGAKRVIVAAPLKVGDVLNIAFGINEYPPPSTTPPTPTCWSTRRTSTCFARAARC